MGETQSDSIKIGNKIRLPTLCISIEYSTYILARAIRQQKEIRGIHIRKEEAKLLLFANDIIVCMSDPKASNRVLLKLINTFSNVVEYKINSKMSVTLLYTNDKQGEKEIRNVTMYNNQN